MAEVGLQGLSSRKFSIPVIELYASYTKMVICFFELAPEDPLSLKALCQLALRYHSLTRRILGLVPESTNLTPETVDFFSILWKVPDILESRVVENIITACMLSRMIMQDDQIISTGISNQRNQGK